jgi:hypothetical protein
MMNAKSKTKKTQTRLCAANRAQIALTQVTDEVTLFLGNPDDLSAMIIICVTARSIIHLCNSDNSDLMNI